MKVTALEFVEMLATLDRQIAQLTATLASPATLANVKKIAEPARDRWRMIRQIVAEKGQAGGLSAEQSASLAALFSAAEAADVVLGRHGEFTDTVRKAVDRAKAAFAEAA